MATIYCCDHFAMYIKVKSLCTPTTNALLLFKYVNKRKIKGGDCEDLQNRDN